MKIKPCPTGLTASNIIPQSTETKDTVEDEGGEVFNSAPVITIDPVEKGGFGFKYEIFYYFTLMNAYN